MASRDDMLHAAIDRQSTPVYMSTKAQIVEYYRDRQVKGEIKSWRQALVKDLAASIRSNGQEVKEKSLQRRFDPSRLASVEKKSAGQYKTLGQKLPAVSKNPNGEVKITVKGNQGQGTRGGHRERTITVTFRGPDAYKFVNDPSWSDIWEEYGFDFDDVEDDYGLDVTSVS